MSAPHDFEIFVNNKPFRTSSHELTGAAVKALAGIPIDYSLYLERGHESLPVSDAEEVKVHNKERFRAIPAATMGYWL